MAEKPTPTREPLPPGQLPNIWDTNPPPMHPATVVGDGVVYIDEAKLHPPARHAPAAAEKAPERHAPPASNKRPATEA